MAPRARRRAAAVKSEEGIVQRTGRKANNNNNYLIRVDGREERQEWKERVGGKGLMRVRNICNGLFYSSDLSAAVELMAAEISHGNETIGMRSAMGNGEREE